MNDASDSRLVNTMSNMSTYKYYEAINFSEMNNGILQPGEQSMDIVIGVGNTGGLKIPISTEYCRRSGCSVVGIYKIGLNAARSVRSLAQILLLVLYHTA